MGKEVLGLRGDISTNFYHPMGCGLQTALIEEVK
jgi:hypothetical protein